MSTLSEIVLAEDLASSEVVRGAAEVAERERSPLVVALVRECGVDEMALVAAIRRQMRVSLVEPSRLEPDSDAMRRVERDVCRRLRVMPIGIMIAGSGQTRLKVAMADPTDRVAIAEVEHLSGCEVEPQLATLSAVDELIEKHYRQFVTEVMKQRPTGRGKGRRAFGDGLEVNTTPHASGEGANPATVPFHRVADEAELQVRLEALVSLLIERGVVDEAEYDEAIRQLLRQRGE